MEGISREEGNGDCISMTANEITAALLIEIPKKYGNVRVWRNNRIEANVVGRGGNMRHVSAGIDGQGDISGIARITDGGTFGVKIEIEVKAGRDRMRDTQLAFKKMIQDYGGIYIECRDVAQALLDLEGEMERMRHQG